MGLRQLYGGQIHGLSEPTWGGAPAPSPIPTSPIPDAANSHVDKLQEYANYANNGQRDPFRSRTVVHFVYCIRINFFAKQDAAPLFFGSPNWQNSRIPAEVERSFAVNFLQKQQKQQKQRGPFQRDTFGKTCRSDLQPVEEDRGEGVA